MSSYNNYNLQINQDTSIIKYNLGENQVYFSSIIMNEINKNILHGNVNSNCNNIENTPENFKLELKHHQKRILYEMLEKEKISYRVTCGINAFVLADKVGSGKSIDVLALISKKPIVEKKNLNKLIYKVNKYTFFNGFTINETIDIQSNLIIVPHTIYNQWISYIQKFTSLKYLEVKTKKDLDNLTKKHFEEPNYEIILVKSTKCTEFAQILFKFFPVSFKTKKNENLIIPYEKLGSLVQKIRLLMDLDEVNISNLQQLKTIRDQLNEINLDNLSDKVDIHGKYILKNILEYTGPVFQRVFIDEANSIKIPRFPKIVGKYNWFITSSVKDLMNPHGSSIQKIDGIRGTGFIKDVFINNSTKNLCNFIQDMYIKNNDDFIKQSFNLPEPEYHFIKCYTPPELKVLSGLGLSEIIKALNAGDINTAIKHCGCEQTDENSLIEKVLHDMNTELESKSTFLNEKKQNLQKMSGLPKFIPTNEFSGYKELYVFKFDKKGLGYYTDTVILKNKIKNIKVAIKNNDTQVTNLRQKVDSLKSRISNVNEKECPICTQKVTSPSMTPCCKNIFCFECIMMSLNYSKKKSCPLCRENIQLNSISTITSNIVPNIEEDKLPTKLDTLLNIIQSKKDGKFLIFSEYDNSFEKVVNLLDKNSITWSKLSGSTSHIDNTIKKFENKELKILLLNAKFFGSGLNLQMTTDIILFHRMSSDLEKQIIGRGQRPGRTESLQVHYLCYENEITHS